MRQHISSLRHQNLEKGLPVPPRVKDVDPTIPPTDTTDPEETSVQPRPKPVQYKCEICNCILNSTIQLHQHLASSRHKAILEGKPPKPRWMPYHKYQASKLEARLKLTTARVFQQQSPHSIAHGTPLIYPTGGMSPSAAAAATQRPVIYIDSMTGLPLTNGITSPVISTSPIGGPSTQPKNSLQNPMLPNHLIQPIQQLQYSTAQSPGIQAQPTYVQFWPQQQVQFHPQLGMPMTAPQAQIHQVSQGNVSISTTQAQGAVNPQNSVQSINTSPSSTST